MTKTKTILGLSLAAVFAVSMLGSVYAAGHVFFDTVEVKKSEEGKNLLDVHIKVQADIPETGAFGYGLVGNFGFNNVLALTSHTWILDHSSQDNAADGILHPHVLDLKAPTSACSSTTTLEVDLAKTVETENNFDAPYDTEVTGDTVWVTGVPKSDLAGKIKAIVSFTIVPVIVDDVVTNLCLTIKDTAFP